MADEETLTGWADQFVGSKQNMGVNHAPRFGVNISGPLRLRALLEEQSAMHGSIVGAEAWGSGYWEGSVQLRNESGPHKDIGVAGWTFYFGLPTHGLTALVEGSPLQVMIAADGRARAHWMVNTPLQSGDSGEPVTQAKMRQVVAELIEGHGGTPAFRDWTFSQAIRCPTPPD